MNHGGESFLEPTFSTALSRAQTWPGNHVALSENRMPSQTLNPLAPWIIWIPLNIANLVASPIFRRVFCTGTSPWHGAKLLNYCYIHEGPGELARALIAASSREQQQPFFFPNGNDSALELKCSQVTLVCSTTLCWGVTKEWHATFVTWIAVRLRDPPQQPQNCRLEQHCMESFLGKVAGLSNPQCVWILVGDTEYQFFFFKLWSVPHEPRKEVNFLRLVQKNHQVTPEKSS